MRAAPVRVADYLARTVPAVQPDLVKEDRHHSRPSVSDVGHTQDQHKLVHLAVYVNDRER